METGDKEEVWIVEQSEGGQRREEINFKLVRAEAIKKLREFHARNKLYF